MAGRPREPIDLIKYKNKKHLTSAEYEERKSGELHVPFTEVQPPDYLNTEAQREIFSHYAEMLVSLGIFTELDVDCLARYVLAHELYLTYTSMLLEMDSESISVRKDLQNMQDKAFKQAQTAAKDLGLTITSRAKLVVPQPFDPDDDEL